MRVSRVQAKIVWSELGESPSHEANNAMSLSVHGRDFTPLATDGRPSFGVVADSSTPSKDDMPDGASGVDGVLDVVLECGGVPNSLTKLPTLTTPPTPHNYNGYPKLRGVDWVYLVLIALSGGVRFA